MVSRIVKLNFWFENHSKSTGLLAEPETGLRGLGEFAVAANYDAQIPDRSPRGRFALYSPRWHATPLKFIRYSRIANSE
jgi:hypothetical protein